MRYFSTIILALLASTCWSQSSRNLFRENIDAHVDIVPLRFPDPSVRFGSEYMLGGRWSVGLNLGVGVPITGNAGLGFMEPRWEKDYRLIEARPEIKFYWFKRERIGWYMAAEGFVSKMNASAGTGYHFLPDSDTLQINFDQADFQKTKIGMIGKLGGRFLLGQRITLDFFSGLGLSKTKSSYNNYVNHIIKRSDPFFEGENYTVGRRVTAHLSFGLRLGLIVWAKKPSE
ncbi:DUF3575 domain-containing protein [Dyadobacter sp. LJ53]|uniref:DUF3575 domain-containing protein n=1 Tax=Dyadobacter chenwenxiniae TaxID=2906456 RepID=UPI001F254E1D|nr:DUF3575 domain-containing protein [Dyadobacter chenwenxiniae]MCF0049152.1 DUF3575 domain-containing protein [Dyadobacter chenwenxiniae]